MTFKRRFTAHPIQVFYYLKPTLFILMIPLFRTLVMAFLRREVNGLFLNEIILAALIIAYSVVKWRRFNLLLTNDGIIINEGLFFSTTAEIKRERISSVQKVRYISDRLFGSVTLRINTESGRRGKADFEIKLSCRDAELVCNELFLKTNQTTLRFSAVRVAIMAAASSSAFTGLIFIVPLIRQTGILLGTAIEELLLNRINQINEAASRIIPPAINTITIIFLSLYAVAFLISFFKYVNFNVRLTNGTMRITSGFLTRFDIVFKVKSVNSAIIEQTPLMRLLDRYLVRVSIGGYGDNKGYRAVVIPSARRREVKGLFESFFPNTQREKEKMKTSISIRPHKKSKSRFYFIPTAFLAVIFLGYLVLSNMFPVFSEILAFVLLVFTVIVLYYYNLAEHNYRNSEIRVSDIVYAKCSRWASTREMFCEARRVGLIHITMWPPDFRYKTCNIRLTERSEGAETIAVKHIQYDEIKQQLADFYGFGEE